MKLSPRRRDDAAIDLTPLIDVVFLLLIFFMVSTTFERDSALSIELPEASAEASPAPDRTIEVAIDAEGRFYVDGRQLVNTQVESIERALRKAAEGAGEAPPVLVDADASTPHQAVVSVMDAARRAGLSRLTFAARLVPEEGR